MVSRGGWTTKEGDVGNRGDVMEGSDIVRAVTEQTAAQNRHLSPRMMRLLAFVHECRGELLSAVQYEEMADMREEVDVEDPIDQT